MAGVSHKARAAAWIAAGVLGGGLIAGVAVAQFGVATAASPSPKPGNGYAQERPMRGMHGGPLGRLGHLGGQVLHGEATVRTPKGADQVVEFQRGTITAISASALTVKSADGFTADYTVDKTTRIVLNGTSGTLSTLKTNDSVRVFAVKNGATATAKSVVDGMPRAPMGFGGWRGGPTGGATGGAPAEMPGMPGMMQPT